MLWIAFVFVLIFERTLSRNRQMVYLSDYSILFSQDKSPMSFFVNSFTLSLFFTSHGMLIGYLLWYTGMILTDQSHVSLSALYSHERGGYTFYRVIIFIQCWCHMSHMSHVIISTHVTLVSAEWLECPYVGINERTFRDCQIPRRESSRIIRFSIKAGLDILALYINTISTVHDNKFTSKTKAYY